MPEPKKILVVSSSRLLFDKLNELLNNAGFDMQYISSQNPQLKEIIEQQKPRVIVVDPEIPGLEGLKLSLQIRNWSPAPILMISAARSGPQEIRILDVTSQDWLSEPLAVDLVAVRVNSII